MLVIDLEEEGLARIQWDLRKCGAIIKSTTKVDLGESPSDRLLERLATRDKEYNQLFYKTDHEFLRTT